MQGTIEKLIEHVRTVHFAMVLVVAALGYFTLTIVDETSTQIRELIRLEQLVSVITRQDDSYRPSLETLVSVSPVYAVRAKQIEQRLRDELGDAPIDGFVIFMLCAETRGFRRPGDLSGMRIRDIRTELSDWRFDCKTVTGAGSIRVLDREGLRRHLLVSSMLVIEHDKSRAASAIIVRDGVTGWAVSVLHSYVFDFVSISLTPGFDARFPLVAQRMSTLGEYTLREAQERLMRDATDAAQRRKAKLFDLEIDGRYAIGLLAAAAMIALLTIGTYLSELARLVGGGDFADVKTARVIWIGLHQGIGHGLVTVSLAVAPVIIVVGIFQVEGWTWYVAVIVVPTVWLGGLTIRQLYDARRAFDRPLPPGIHYP